MRRHAKARSAGSISSERRRAASRRQHRGLLAACSCAALFAAVLPAVASATVGPLVLPDNRHWEMVSPVDKNNGEVVIGELGQPAVAAADGNGLVYQAIGAFAGQPSSLLGELDYLARRGPTSWQTEGIMMPFGRLHAQNNYMGFTDDLEKGVVRWVDDSPYGTHDPNAVPGVNLYMRDNQTKQFTLLNGTMDALGSEGGGMAWASSDFSHVLFDSRRKLTPDSPCKDDGFERCAYEWVDGSLRLASILPGEVPAQGSPGAGRVGALNVDNALSDDGARLFFTNPVDVFGEGSLYMRTDGGSTVEVSASERTVPSGSTDRVCFQGAEAAHGNRVIFTTRRDLVDEDDNTSNDLYLYEATKPAGERLTLISIDENAVAPDGAEVTETLECSGVAAKNENLTRVYFVANNQIVEGAPENSGPKLFLWDETEGTPRITYVATLNESEDIFVWMSGSVVVGRVKSARVDPSGRYLAFKSVEQLTATDTNSEDSVYLYDAVENTLDCASCSADLFPATGDVDFDRAESGYPPVNHLLRSVSSQGHVFFESKPGLLPADSNGKRDVYQYRDGQLNLISLGTGGHDSYFIDASVDGRDVFFSTRDQLVGWDVDDSYDAYDARVDGGLPEPPPEPPLCEGDACQPPPVVPNDPSPSSASLVGPGDPKAEKPRRRCARGKVRRQGKCRKRHRPARQGTKNRQATRSNG